MSNKYSFLCLTISLIYIRPLLHLRTDTGVEPRFAFFSNYSGTIVAKILYYTSNERVYFSLSNGVIIRRFRQKIIKMEI